MERVDGIAAPAQAKQEPIKAAKAQTPKVDVPAAKQNEPVEQAAKAEVKVEKPKAEKVDSMDVASLRRLWPDVIENVKKRRRLTWSLLSASAQIIAVDDKAITIGILNAGARDSFVRSESDEILRQAFIEIVGIDRKIEVVVDASIDTTSTPEARAVRKDEAPTDKNLLSGAALLAAELGATVISEKKKD